MCSFRGRGPDVRMFREFVDEIRIPDCILEERFVNSISGFDDQMCGNRGRFFRPPDYRGWVRSLADNQRQSDDPYDLERWGYTLYTSWSSHFMAVLDSESGNEAEIRNGTDNLFRLAFQQRSGWKHRLKEERDGFLPEYPFTATANIVVSMTLPDSWATHLWTLDNPHIFAAELDLGTVVTFVSEAKCKEATAAKRQLTLDLCSAQHQRRALGFEDGQIFGATIVHNSLTMFCSIWENKKVVVYPVYPEFNLHNFSTFIECHIFLCKVSDYVGTEVNKAFKDWETEAGRSRFEQNRRRNITGNPWRRRNRPPRSTTTTTTTRDSSHLGGDGCSARDEMEPLEMESSGGLGDIEMQDGHQAGDRLMFDFLTRIARMKEC